VARKAKRAVVDATAALGAHGLTDQYRQAVTAALPAGTNPSEEFWRDLETVVAAFFAFQRQHRPPKRELKRWQHIGRMASDLGSELRAISLQTPSSAHDPLWSNRALAALWPVKLKADAAVIAYATIRRAFRGRQNPYRAYLYGAVCDLWRWHLGQKLAYSRTRKGAPYGPLIRFFTACVGPLLGDEMPTSHGIGSIIDREQRALSYFFDPQK
jgi:hypothetical protein